MDFAGDSGHVVSAIGRSTRGTFIDAPCSPSQCCAFSQIAGDSLRLVPVRLTGLLPFELSTECAGDVNEAPTFLPAPPSLVELSGSDIFGITSLASLPVPTVKSECPIWPHP